MRTQLGSRWQKIKRPLEIIGIVLVLIMLATVIVLIILGYTFNWDWTGLKGYSQISTTEQVTSKATKTITLQPVRTLWDWLQLLIIPFVLAIGGYVFNLTVSRNEQKNTQLHDQTEREIALDNQQEAALQTYIDKMSELLLDKKLRESKPDDELRNVARIRTLTMLYQLNARRTNYMLAFLRESGLVTGDTDTNIITFSNADLRTINLHGVELYNIDLNRADLNKADLNKANLSRANLSGANLSGANLAGALLTKATLSRANLYKANLYQAYLTEADLTKATLSESYLSESYLSGATLSGANLNKADLSRATLYKADLNKANLSQANLTEANLSGANLSEADLSRTKHVRTEQLKEVRSLQGATMPDGTKHP